MSDKPKKLSRAWIKPAIILAFFCMNVLAAYVPTPLFLREISFSSRPKDVFFRVPVALACLAVDSYMAPKPWGSFEQFMRAERELLLIDRGVVVTFLLILFVASAHWYSSKIAWFAMPSIVFVYSLLQGVIAAIIIGLNALGGV